MNEETGIGQSRSTDPVVRTNTRRTWVYGMAQGLLRLLAISLFDLKAYGLKNIPTHGGVLIVSNHQSYLDPAVLGVKVKRPMSFMAKSELFVNKVFSFLICSVNAFSVRQGDGDVGAIRETINRLQEGHVLVMFPEGGRTMDGEIEKMEGGMGLIVRRAGPAVKVVPAAVYGAYQAWSRHRFLPHPAPIRVKYGQAMDLSNKRASEIVRILETEIHRLFEELRAEAKQPIHRRWSRA
jgi:1-acyl-sn-glycerol-3-phosphate acyltransferase